MTWFKSLWLKLRKSNGLPGNEVLIPIEKETVQEYVKKPRKPRVKKESSNESNA